MNGLIDFECEVYESGYEVICVELDRKYLLPDESFTVSYISPIDSNSTKRLFNLRDHPGAYKEILELFACIAEEVDSVVEDLDVCLINFANKYGSFIKSSSSISGDTYTLISHISMMTVANSSMNAIKEGDIEKLNELFVKVDDNFKVCIDDEPIFKGDHSIPIIGQTPPRNVSEAAYHYVCKVVNKNLKDSLTTEIIVNKTNTGTDMVVRPKDLISALWLQLAHAVSRNIEFKQCAACSTFFEVKSKKRKDQKIYCSTRCRVRVAARKRREKEKAS